jgi:hypothetical protein
MFSEEIDFEKEEGSINPATYDPHPSHARGFVQNSADINMQPVENDSGSFFISDKHS